MWVTKKLIKMLNKSTKHDHPTYHRYPGMAGVLLKENKIIATNGYTLIAIEMDAGNTIANPCIIKPDTIMHLRGTKKSNVESELGFHINCDTEGNIKVLCNEFTASLKSRDISTYPDYQCILDNVFKNKKAQKYVKVSYKPDLLLAAIYPFKDSGSHCTLHIYNEDNTTEPAMISFDNSVGRHDTNGIEKITSLIMPLSLD